jgi:hypothetical protein
MPRFDGSGPMGNGPRTGRGMGNCGGSYNCPRFGFRRFFSKTNELNSLKEEQKFLEEELSAVKDEIKNSQDEK